MAGPAVSWIPILYLPAACLLQGGISAWAHRNLKRPAPALGWFVAVFPFALLAWCLARPSGPHVWAQAALPMGGWRWAAAAGALVTALRWILEVSARRALVRVALHPAFCRLAEPGFQAWLGYAELARRMGIPPRSLPELRISRLADGAWTVGGRILLDAALVPPVFRPDEEAWRLPGPGLDREALGAVLAHELAHVRAKDPLRRRLLVVMCAFLPWEWVHGNRGAVVEGMARFLPYRLLTRGLAWVGRPMAEGLRESRRAGEDWADALAARAVPGAREHLDHVRSLYGQASPGVRPLGPVPPWAAGCLLAVMAILLMAGAPGRRPLGLAFGAGAWTAALPQGWAILAQGGHRVDPLFAPGSAREGVLFVKVRGGASGPPPILRALVRLRADQVPPDSRLVLEWRVRHAGPRPLKGDEVGFSLTQSAMSARENLDPLTFYGVPGPSLQAAGWWTYRQEIQVRGRPDLEFLLLTFHLSAGRYAFKPPLLSLVLPDGGVQSFPTPRSR